MKNVCCPHHWTVTSECPLCLRAAIQNVRACTHRRRQKIGIVGNYWCPDCGAISEPICLGIEPRPEQWTLPGLDGL